MNPPIPNLPRQAINETVKFVRQNYESIRE
jgi:hypothetical protein